MQLSIIIVSYNVKYFLEQCLCAVAAATGSLRAEVIVVDNNSTDDSVNYLQQRFSWVKFIALDVNIGFAKANNIALQQAIGEHILFLNPDTIVPEDALLNCLHFLKNNQRAGAVGVRMIDGGGSFLPESKRAFPTPLVAFFKLCGLSALFPKSKLFNQYSLGFLSEKNVHEVAVLSGAFMMVKKMVLEKTGGFDEQFFMYGEDIDLSYRIQKSGFKNYYLGNISIIHFKGESTSKGSLNYVKLFYKAMVLFVKKHFTGTGAWLMQTALQVAIVIRAFFAALYFVFVLPLKNVFKKDRKAKNIVLIGSEARTAAAELIIKKNSTATINKSTEAHNISAADEVVFCVDAPLNYKKAFELMQQMNKKISIKWFGRFAKSIAGSKYKNESGEVYVMPVKNNK